MKNSISRRSLIKSGLKLGIIAPLLGHPFLACSPASKEAASIDDAPETKLNILILGGTSFLGPHQIAYAISRGHRVATFIRGKTLPTVHQDYFKEVEQLIGDRQDNLSVLENGKWDLVIDNSGHRVEWTKKSAELLKDKAELYLYTSSTGVYYPYLGNDIAETTEVLLKEPEELEDEDQKMEYWYGVMKSNSELETIKAFGEERSIIVRPTYMVGPADRLDRFIHWPVRLAKGGEILVPGRVDDQVQYIDVRDVAEWMIRLAEQKKAGTYNAVGPKDRQTMPEFINVAQDAFDVASTFIQIDDYEFLKENKVHYIVPWIPSEGNNYGSAMINNSKAIQNGLTFRNITDTVRETHDWWYSDALTDERRAKYEMNPDTVLQREQSILEKWKAVKA